MSQWFLALLIAAAVGLVIKSVVHWSDYMGENYDISWVEFGISFVVCAVLVIPTTNWLGNKLAISNQTHFNEFWNGYETNATHEVTQCHRDGSCEHTYQCDPYTVMVAYTVTDSDGNSHTEYRAETHYHDCPYVTEENAFYIDTTLGKYTVADGWFDDNPRAWRGDKGIPNVERGTPQFWQEAKARIDAGAPGGVTAVKKYENFILASQQTILHKFSDEVKKYQKLLPPPVKNPKSPIHDYYYANKLSFQHTPANANDWNNSLTRFNAALGSDLQGDLHLVVVDSSVDPAQYTGALNAYWTGKTFGKNALSKNGIALILGVKDNTIEWARGFTGMPVGNAAMVQDFTNLKGTAFDPTAIFGSPKAVIKGDKVAITPGDGALEKIVWGPHKFQRVCMTCKDGGYNYLKGEIQPTHGQRWAILLVAVLLCCFVWAIGLFTFIGERK